jgi:hypothetical protein
MARAAATGQVCVLRLDPCRDHKGTRNHATGAAPVVAPSVIQSHRRRKEPSVALLGYNTSAGFSAYLYLRPTRRHTPIVAVSAPATNHARSRSIGSRFRSIATRVLWRSAFSANPGTSNDFVRPVQIQQVLHR